MRLANYHRRGLNGSHTFPSCKAKGKPAVHFPAYWSCQPSTGNDTTAAMPGFRICLAAVVVFLTSLTGASAHQVDSVELEFLRPDGKMAAGGSAGHRIHDAGITWG